MSFKFLVHTPSGDLSSQAHKYLSAANAEYQVLMGGNAERALLASKADQTDVVDLVYVPSGGWPDMDAARAMLDRPGARRFGILSDDAGLVQHRVGKGPLSLFYRPFTAQADEGVYTAGGDYRTRYGAVSEVPAPRQVYLGLTQRCNRSCTFCVSRSFEFDLLSVEQIDQLCDELAGAVDMVALTGAGEAMMHPRFWDIVDLLCERLPGIQFKMNTSGLAIIKHAERLMQYPIKNVTVSLNAATVPTYEKFVGPGFHAVLKGIEALANARARANRADLHLCLSMVLMKSTVGETAELASIAAQLGIEEIQGIYLMINDDSLAHESLWHDPELSNRALAQAGQHAKALGVKASLPPEFRSRYKLSDRDQAASLPTSQGQRCTEAWSTVYIRPDGNIIACPYMERSMGNIRHQPLRQIWNGESYRRLRQGLISRNFCAECRSCCGFNETGSVDEYPSHWLGSREPSAPSNLLPIGAI